jgi:FkbM family methyltransferase
MGAHMGLFTFRALLLGAAHVYCYEPNPENFSLLRRNMQRNGLLGTRVTLYNAAVSQGEAVVENGGQQAQEAQLFLATQCHQNGELNNYRHSLLSVPPGGMAANAKTHSVSVAVTRFADVISRHPNVTAIKIDIEGAEVAILSQPQLWPTRLRTLGA